MVWKHNKRQEYGTYVLELENTVLYHGCLWAVHAKEKSQMVSRQHVNP